MTPYVEGAPTSPLKTRRALSTDTASSCDQITRKAGAVSVSLSEVGR